MSTGFSQYLISRGTVHQRSFAFERKLTKESELNETNEASSRRRSVVEGNELETEKEIRSKTRQGEGCSQEVSERSFLSLSISANSLLVVPCPKRDGPGQIGELAVEIGWRFVNSITSSLATPDAFEPRNHSHSTGFKMPRLEDLWDMEQYFKAVRAPFDDQVTMATMCLSGDVKNI
ncbi:UNVERIFIED_CONTAM: hypothetical protein Scaly_3064800 [Sesamum calycinum]|uniref:Uncharacterized protein n=2 Tax=Sesamum TaxID=4181 RepID=A0AAW2JTU7_9LAMI